MERVEFPESRSLAEAVAAVERGDEVVVTRAGTIVAEVRAALTAGPSGHDLDALRRLRTLASPLKVGDATLLIREMRDADEH